MGEGIVNVGGISHIYVGGISHIYRGGNCQCGRD